MKESLPEIEKENILGLLKDGHTVIDRPQSHLHANIDKTLLEDALSQTESLDRDFFIETVEFDKEIGNSNCVETNNEDEIIYAQRPFRKGRTRFVKNRAPEPTNKLTLILKKRDAGGYVLIGAFLDPKAEPEPWDKNKTSESQEFWNTHALIWGSEEIVQGTES